MHANVANNSSAYTTPLLASMAWQPISSEYVFEI
jgi:hypothetical protein